MISGATGLVGMLAGMGGGGELTNAKAALAVPTLREFFCFLNHPLFSFSFPSFDGVEVVSSTTGPVAALSGDKLAIGLSRRPLCECLTLLPKRPKVVAAAPFVGEGARTAEAVTNGDDPAEGKTKDPVLLLEGRDVTEG